MHQSALHASDVVRIHLLGDAMRACRRCGPRTPVLRQVPPRRSSCHRWRRIGNMSRTSRTTTTAPRISRRRCTDPEGLARSAKRGHDRQPGIKLLVLQLKCDRHRVSSFEHLFASSTVEHEQVFAVKQFSERLFAPHVHRVRRGCIKPCGEARGGTGRHGESPQPRPGWVACSQGNPTDDRTGVCFRAPGQLSCEGTNERSPSRVSWRRAEGEARWPKS